MFKYNFKIAGRTLLKSKIFTVLNIFGLTVGITSCILIATVVIDEFSYDRFWSRADDIYRLLRVNPEDSGWQHRVGGSVNDAIAPALVVEFPEVESYTNMYLAEHLLKIGKDDQHMLTIDMIESDSAVYDFLDVHLVSSEENLDPIKGINKIIVSERFAATHFKANSALGSTIYKVARYQEKMEELRIVGVMKDLPKNTILRSDIIYLNPRRESVLGDKDFYTHKQHFIRLAPKIQKSEFELKMNNWYANLGLKDSTTRYELQSIKQAYLQSDFPVNQPLKGNIKHLYIFSLVSLFILGIACINYINLSTARANSRLQEMAIRKVLGASRKRIILQFLLETAILFGIATTITLFIYPIAMNLVVDFIGHPIQISLFSSWKFGMCTLAAILIVCVLTSFYPAWHISSFQAGSTLKDHLSKGNSPHQWLRKGLVVTQFSISIIVIIALIVVQRQFDFMLKKEVGYHVDGLIGIDDVSWDGKAEVFKQELSKLPVVTSTSYTSWLPTQGTGYMVRTVESASKDKKKIELWYIAAESNFASTLGLDLQSGRFLKDSLRTDVIDAGDFESEENATRSAIMSASTAKMIGVSELDLPHNKLNPVGIVKDFNTDSFHKAAVPTVIVGYTNPQYSAMLIRVPSGHERNAMQQIANIWESLFPNKPLLMDPIADKLQEAYIAESKLQSLFQFFSAVSLLLAVLGLFGLVVNSTELRTKEIGLRKVLGASVSGIVTLISKDFVRLVVLSLLIASPIAWWAMNKWLADYAYRIDMAWWMFALAGFTAVFVAAATISYQAIRAARANPVDSLRDE